MNKGRLVLMGALMALSTLAFLAWYYLPIYPDEVAVQLLSGRYIPDHGLAQKLFYLCPTNARETPFLFVIPAWIYSWLCLHLSLVGMRIFPFAATLAAVFLAIGFATKGRNPAAAFIATTAFIGVAGSSLVIARSEYWQVLNVVCCMWGFINLESASLRIGKCSFLAILIVLSCIFSIYSHIQGMIFLPLSLYLTYHLVSSNIGRICTVILLVTFFFIVAVTAFSFHNFSCSGYPGIEQYVKDMVINSAGLKLANTDWLTTKLIDYTQSFYYKDSYAINYLPGISVENGWLKTLIPVLNQSIRIILVSNLIFFVCAAIAAIIFAGKQCVMAYRQHETDRAVTKGLDEAHVIILFAFPLIALFFYDAAQCFYRSIFINLLASIMLSVLFSQIYLARLRTVATTYFVFCGVVVLASLAVNVWWFTDKFHAGFEGPLISINKNWDAINRDVLMLAQDCGMDLPKGRIIVDDMTYESLKRYPFLYPVTYLKLSGKLDRLTSTEIISRVRPNFAIVRCNKLVSWGVAPQEIRNQLCGVNFLSKISRRLELNTYTPFNTETTLTNLACVSGWNLPEKSGTWTASPTAELYIQLAKDPGGDVLVAMDIGLLNLPGVKNRIRITAKGQELFAERFAEGMGSKKILFTYPGQLLNNDHALHMTLESDIHVLGKLQPETHDTRNLGIFLIAVRVEKSSAWGTSSPR